jgi:hypothetical protein
MRLTLEDLPPADIKRWVIRRKAEVVVAVRSGLIDLDQVCERYNLSVEEFQAWARLIDRHGLRGLRTTRLQDYRKPRNGAAKIGDFKVHGGHGVVLDRDPIEARSRDGDAESVVKLDGHGRLGRMLAR